MKEIELEELKQIQMNVMDAIHEFCIEHGIKYSLAAGTLIGAIRHKGYIPWDDDIDIYLLREDYNRLIQEFPEVYNNHYQLISLERDPKWDFPYAKAYDNRTIFKENALVNVTIGVNIDIFPIDNIPDDEKEWRKYEKWRKKVVMFSQMQRSKMYNAKRRLGVNLIFLITHFISYFITRRKVAEYISHISQKFNKVDTQYVFENVFAAYLRRRLRRDIFAKYIDVPFEDRIYRAFEKYDEYLRMVYGDYMQLPPLEGRITHHSYKAFHK